MTRMMLRDALSALAVTTLASGAAGDPASAQGKSVKVFRAEIAMDAVRGAKSSTLGAEKQAAPLGAQDVMSLTGPAPRRTPTGEDWRWFQDYGGGR